MILEEIKLKNFRNYENLNLKLDPSLTLITGNNGIGKTNILESIQFLSNLHSFRVDDDKELIMKGKENALISANDNTNNYKISIQKYGKTLWFNNNLIKKTSDYIGLVNAILFEPEDLNLFRSPPAKRRILMDIEIAKTSKEYLNALRSYKKILKDKNKLLKSENINLKYLDVLDESAIPYILLITKKREEFITYVNNICNKKFREISNLDTNISISYKCFYQDNEPLNILKKAREKDIALHFASIGIHREDIIFKINNYPVETYASQGQKRMIAIAFKLALSEYFKDLKIKKPIILLDDILSELDEENISRLFNQFNNNNQIIITCTKKPDNLKNFNYKHIDLQGGDYGTN